MSLGRLLRTGSRHRRVLDRFGVRVGVTGIRGKTSAVRALHGALRDRGYESVAKITGDVPQMLHDGETIPIIDRGPRVTLQENHRLAREHAEDLAKPPERCSLVVENHALSEYTMRMFNETFLEPHVIVLTNIRRDHATTLGKRLATVTRSFARSIPRGTTVVTGEKNPVLVDYLERELDRRDAPLETARVPPEHDGRIGAEAVHAISEALALLGEDPLPGKRIEYLLSRMVPTWAKIDGTRLYFAADVNDIESTEMFREALAGSGPGAEPILPFVFLRADRRGRTAAFASYVNELLGDGLAHQVHVAGPYTRAFVEAVDGPTVIHPHAPETVPAVLDRLLDTGPPVMIMGNTVHPFMRTLYDEIQDRASR